MRIRIAVASAVFLAALAGTTFPKEDLGEAFDRDARRAVPRDAFPVLTNPKMVSPEKAEGVRADDMVIGITAGGRAKAYPIPVMGRHELVNDEIGGIPIAVSW